MGAFTEYASAAILNSLFGKTSNFGALATAPSLYLGLSSTQPGPAGAGVTEPSAGGYARVAAAAADWNAAAAPPAWVASTAYFQGQEIIDSNGNLQRATTGGTSGSTAPTWATTVNSTTSDGSVTWTLISLSSPAQLISNSTAIAWPKATGDWLSGANLTYVVFYDAATAGNLIASAALAVAKPVLSGDTVSLNVGDVQVSLN